MKNYERKFLGKGFEIGILCFCLLCFYRNLFIFNPIKDRKTFFCLSVFFLIRSVAFSLRFSILLCKQIQICFKHKSWRNGRFFFTGFKSHLELKKKMGNSSSSLTERRMILRVMGFSRSPAEGKASGLKQTSFRVLGLHYLTFAYSYWSSFSRIDPSIIFSHDITFHKFPRSQLRRERALKLLSFV